MYDGYMAETSAKLTERPQTAHSVAGQRAALERQTARIARESGQPAVFVAQVARKDPAFHGKFGPTRIGGPSA